MSLPVPQPLICHLTAHLGGGVGRALDHLIAHDQQFQHEIVTIERTQSQQSLRRFQKLGVTIRILSEVDCLEAYFASFDILQIEYWNSPVLHRALNCLSLQPARWVFWCHISGLNSPIIPSDISQTADACVLTTSVNPATLIGEVDRTYCIPSAAGLDVSDYKSFALRSIDALYAGTLSPAKMHWQYSDYLKRFLGLGFRRAIVAGDITPDCNVCEQVTELGIEARVSFPGFVSEISNLYQQARYFLYILNPRHYGSGENALIEAMSAGAVPIVLDNQVEANIILDGETGYVLKGIEDFDRVKDLLKQEQEWSRISLNSMAYVAKKYRSDLIAEQFNSIYGRVLTRPKKSFPFTSVFGGAPSDWFLANRADRHSWSADTYLETLEDRGDYAVIADTKGSLAHYARTFPEDVIIRRWFEMCRIWSDEN